MKSEQVTTANLMASSQTQYECEKCKDTGFLYTSNWSVEECSCYEVKKMIRRFKSAMIPEEFKQANFPSYIAESPIQKDLLKAAKDYINEFQQIRNTTENSIGFVADFGEQRIKALSGADRQKAKREKNSFGLGKTHLQVAMAKHLIKQGIGVLMVSDVALMEELMSLKMMDDKTDFKDRVHALINVPVLLWDDIGKASPTEAKKSMYFHIINERYRYQRPIIYSSNEDADTLAERIGDAATSRLFGMSFGRIIAVKGADYRLTKKKGA